MPVYVEAALKREKGSSLTNTGALAVFSGAKTGRSPKDKRVVAEPTSEDNVWWGPVNIKMSPESFMINRERAIDYLRTRDQLYVVDAYAGWDPAWRIPIRIVTERAYHVRRRHRSHFCLGPRLPVMPTPTPTLALPLSSLRHSS